jgi:hypothetical protein
LRKPPDPQRASAVPARAGGRFGDVALVLVALVAPVGEEQREQLRVAPAVGQVGGEDLVHQRSARHRQRRGTVEAEFLAEARAEVLGRAAVARVQALESATRCVHRSAPSPVRPRSYGKRQNPYHE